MFDEAANLQATPQVDENFISILLDGLTTAHKPHFHVQAATNQLADLSPEDKRTVVAKTCYFFYAIGYPDFAQQPDELLDDYSCRLCQVIVTKINENFRSTSAINTASPAYPFVHSPQLGLRPSGRLRGPIYPVALSPALSPMLDFQSPNRAGQIFNSPVKALSPTPSIDSADRTARYTKTQLYKKWFFDLSRGEFFDAMTVEAELNNNGITIDYKLMDEHGKSLGDYLCEHVARLSAVLNSQSNASDKLKNLLPLLQNLNCLNEQLKSQALSANMLTQFSMKIYDFDCKLARFSRDEAVNLTDNEVQNFNQAIELHNKHVLSDCLQHHKTSVKSGEASPYSALAQFIISSPFSSTQQTRASNREHDMSDVVARLFPDDEQSNIGLVSSESFAESDMEEVFYGGGQHHEVESELASVSPVTVASHQGETVQLISPINVVNHMENLQVASHPLPELVEQTHGASTSLDSALVLDSQRSALTSYSASAFHRSSHVQESPKRNFLTQELPGDNKTLDIDKNFIAKLLSTTGLYATKRNKGVCFNMGWDGSNTIDLIRVLIGRANENDKISLAAIRAIISQQNESKCVNFFNQPESCGSSRVLAAINNEFNKIASNTATQASPSVF